MSKPDKISAQIALESIRTAFIAIGLTNNGSLGRPKAIDSWYGAEIEQAFHKAASLGFEGSLKKAGLAKVIVGWAQMAGLTSEEIDVHEDLGREHAETMRAVYQAAKLEYEIERDSAHPTLGT